MRFAVLGPLEVYRDGAIVPIAAGAQLRLLEALLSRTGKRVSVNALVDALWPEDPPASAVKSVQVYVTRLRRNLGEPDRITRHDNGYTIQLGAGELDAHEFADLVQQARQARDTDQPDWLSTNSSAHSGCGAANRTASTTAAPTCARSCCPRSGGWPS